MKEGKLILKESAFSGDGPIIATNTAPDYEYVGNVRDNTKMKGRRVTVVFPANGYESQVVRVSDPVDNLSALLEKATADKPVRVTFEGFAASIYSIRGEDGHWRRGISAKAERVKPVFDDDDVIV